VLATPKLALMLGVTTAMHILEGEHLIKSTRGRVRVIDRAKLEAMAGASYGLPEAKCEWVIGGLVQEHASPPLRIVTVR
jgi:hypothetical protein